MRSRRPDELWLSSDRKVSPRGTYQESRDRWTPRVLNSLGLPAGDSCPGMTAFCRDCYASSAEQSAGVRKLVQHNLALLQSCSSVEEMAVLLVDAIGRYERYAIRNHVMPLLFRVHWDGDFFSVDYARAWAVAVRLFPRIRFWVYTRSFRPPVDVIPELVGIPNLKVYLSIDAANHVEAEAQRARWPELHGAYCGRDYRRARGLRPEMQWSAVPCPENAGRMQLNAGGVGACVTCEICVDGRRDILFASSHREDVMVAGPRRRPRAESGAQRAESGAPVRHCAWCDRKLAPHVGRGRPRLYCDQECRWAASHDRQRRRAEGLQVRAIVR